MSSVPVRPSHGVYQISYNESPPFSESHAFHPGLRARSRVAEENGHQGGGHTHASDQSRTYREHSGTRFGLHRYMRFRPRSCTRESEKSFKITSQLSLIAHGFWLIAESHSSPRKDTRPGCEEIQQIRDAGAAAMTFQGQAPRSRNLPRHLQNLVIAKIPLQTSLIAEEEHVL